MPPRKIVRQQSYGDGHVGSVLSTLQPSSRNARVALAVAALTSGSTAGATPSFSLHATRRPLRLPLSAFT